MPSRCWRPCTTCITTTRARIVGSPTWVSLTAFASGAFAPLGWLSFEVASGATAGLMLGYCWYLTVHDAVHRWRLEPDSHLYAAKLRHARHHHGSPERNFGVTIALWDWLLGTAVERGAPGER